MDWLEEGRPLTKLEGFFRDMVKQKIESSVHSIAREARQHGKVIWRILGDEDISFYHERVPSRLRTNKIKNYST
jgi:hypothetical protein